MYNKKIKEFNSKIVLLLLFAIYIYPFYFKNLEIIGYIIIYLLPAIYVLLKLPNFKSIIRKCSVSQFICAVGIIILVIFSLIVPYTHETNDYSYFSIIFAILRKFVIYIFLFILIISKKRNRNENPEIIFMEFYVGATIIYILGTVCFSLCSPLREFWMSVIENEGYSRLMNTYGYGFRVGWQGFSGYRNTFSCSVAVLFILYLLNYKSGYKKYTFRTKKYFFCLIITLIGNMFYGRTGVLCSFIIIFYYIMAEKMLSLSFIVKCGVLTIFFIICIVFLKNKISFINDWIYWMSEPFVNLLETGSFNNYSYTNVTENMIFLPSDHTLLFGDGRYAGSNGSYYMGTDVGFMRLILFWGVIGMLIAYIVVFFSILSVEKKNNMKICMFIIFIIYEFKGEIYYEIIAIMLAIGYMDKIVKGIKKGR